MLLSASQYYVFDGQNTIAARKNLNGSNDVLVKCEVYYDLTERWNALKKVRTRNEIVISMAYRAYLSTLRICHNPM